LIYDADDFNSSMMLGRRKKHHEIVKMSFTNLETV